ncbi:LOW QUALITY PROTEIN: RILP-like protein homolog [Anthonomus grandis grandis]|uniref:LOW QUALITY PROTEIN: RILP-like protein homolog n=1 Tax=Anthonomus grandis grandis TaxID=2921223 RepID=UPI002165FF85|nr:LOW QUALITY PROTEIN: RILP-like protein homolog [Anthonomus grandis grandis]
MPRIGNSSRTDRMEDLSDVSGDVTVLDVYDIASDIGKECEKIIDRYGADAVTSLMPKVISALELLENLATRNERENTLLNDLQLKISQLENDKLEKAEYRQKFEKELETIEEQWRSETKDLVEMVSKLQEENRKLAKIQNPHTSPLTTPDGVNDEVLKKLQDTLEKQRDELREKEKLLQEKCLDAENLKSQIERLTTTSKELRRKHKFMQNQVRTLWDEKADFLVQLQDQQRDVNALRQRLGLAEKENEDLVKSDLPFPANKAIYDLDDPNRPRFTTQELKDILHERNVLKARVSDLEDELEVYRPKKKADTFSRFLSFVNYSSSVDASYNDLPSPVEEALPYPIDEDAPVQGPLPYEPDDAPWKKSSESGIKKFFRKLFPESSGGGGFPKRSLSSLTKMALSSTSDPVQC